MIILHNPFSRKSREFIEANREGNTILEYPNCVQQYPNISAFPSVVVEMPEKTIQAYTIPSYTDPDTGESFPEQYVPEEIISSYTDIVRDPNTMEDVQTYITNYLNEDPGAEYR